MPTRKRTAPEATTTPARHTTKSRGHGGRRAPSSSPISAVRGWDVSQYAVPGAAVLTTGLLAGAGYMFKKKLGDMLGEMLAGATHEASKAGRATAHLAGDAREQGLASLERVLELAGLERRSPLMGILGPAVGAACGFVAGSLVTHFFGAKLLESIGYGTPANDDARRPLQGEVSNTASRTAETIDGSGPNGTAPRSVANHVTK